MASYQTISFDAEKFKDDMLAIEKLCIEEAIRHIQKNEYFINGDVIQIPPSTDNGVAYEVYTSQLKAWIVEYGQGRAMNPNNPFLGEYFGSGFTSPHRTNGAVLKRGAGSYDSINFEKNEIVHHNSGSEPAGTPVSSNLQARLSREPNPFLDSLLNEASVVFINKFDELTSGLDFSRYILVSNPQNI